MIYLKSIGAGIATSIISVIALAVIMAIMNRKEGMVGINILGPLPLAIALLGFTAGFYLVFRNSN